MLNPQINLGPLTLHIYGLIIAIAIYAGWYLAKKRADFFKIKKEDFDDPILFVPLILAIIGARLYHVIDYWQIYSNNPSAIFKIGVPAFFGAGTQTFQPKKFGRAVDILP